MKSSSLFTIMSILFTCLLFFGCASSDESLEKQINPPLEHPRNQSEVPRGRNIDTVDINKQEPPKATEETPSIPTSTARPVGKYTVQIGAYEMPDNADRVSALAKERFGKNVYTILDKMDNLFKVMIGDFMTREEARQFRDQMVVKYYDDYKDAWVSEIPQR